MSSELIIFCGSVAAAPIIAYVAIFWWLDRYEQEPVWLVGLVFLWGAIAAPTIAIGLETLAYGADNAPSAVTMLAVVAPLVEEPAKAAVLLILVLSLHFDNPTDGVVYGAAAGLGFAMTENYLYFKLAYEYDGLDAMVQLVFLRSATSALMHCCATALFGYVLGLFRHRAGVRKWLLGPVVALLPAVLIHTAFNGGLVSSRLQQTGGNLTWVFVMVPIMCVIVAFLTQLSVRREHQILRVELADEVDSGLIPEAHAEIIPFVRKRWRRNWLVPSVNRQKYLRAVTLLAFRKHQARITDADHAKLDRDIERLRERITALLSVADDS